MDQQAASVPMNAAENPGIEVELCGKTYKFREPGKLRVQGLIADAIRLSVKHGLNDMDISDFVGENRDIRKIGLWIGSVPELLEWCIGAMGLGHTERKRIEEAFDPPGTDVAVAFWAMVKMMNAPFAGGSPNTDQDPGAETPSTNGEPTTDSCNDGDAPSNT